MDVCVCTFVPVVDGENYKQLTVLLNQDLDMV